MARRRPRFARYHEKNPTTETYVLVGLGVAALVGVGVFLYSKNAAAAPAMTAAPTAGTPGTPPPGLNLGWSTGAPVPAPSTGGQVFDPNLGGGGSMPGYTQVPGVDTAQNWNGVTTVPPGATS